MGDESTKRAAPEYLAAKLSKEGQSHEDKMNQETAKKLAPAVWKNVASTIITKCREWNDITGEPTFSVKETLLGDLRILCVGKSQQRVVNYDSRRLLKTIKNGGRLEHEKDVVLHIEGYSTNASRAAHLVRNDQPVNLDLLITGELRVLVGLSRQA